jgi:hypothetical protein
MDRISNSVRTQLFCEKKMVQSEWPYQGSVVSSYTKWNGNEIRVFEEKK